jgi:anaerobic selenocysteine-containing dehydrogenase
MGQDRLHRREFLKLEAAAMAAAAGGLPRPLAAQNLVTDRSTTELKWDKAPCRFCGTGCGVMVATKDGRVVATHGDMKAEVNRGLNCVKGYFLSKVMYAATASRTRSCARGPASTTRMVNSPRYRGTRPSTSWPGNSRMR